MINMYVCMCVLAEEFGTGSQNHMTYGAWNASYSMIIAKLAVFGRSLLGCFSRSGHFWPSSLGHLKDPDRYAILPGLFYPGKYMYSCFLFR